jgi:hypothetical protein
MEVDDLHLHHQSPEGKFRFYERINFLLKSRNLKEVRIASAYARWDGLGLISERLEAFLQSGGSLEIVLGFDNGVTSPDCFLYGLYLAEMYGGKVYFGAVTDKYDNSTFHPKVFQFWEKNSVSIISGSANLTGAGVSRNIEVGTEFRVSRDSELARKIWDGWSEIRGYSDSADIAFVRAAKANGRLSSEIEDESSKRLNRTGVILDVGAHAAPKPLFSKFLEIKEPRRRDAALRQLDPASVRPSRLYLQILENETGGSMSGGPGYQIQLPVATLSAFFGVGPSESRDVIFWFGSEEIRVSLTHFENNTHRVRLRPLRDEQRPTIVTFERIAANEYRCDIVPRKECANVLRQSCTQQTRAGARKWGIE